MQTKAIANPHGGATSGATASARVDRDEPTLSILYQINTRVWLTEFSHNCAASGQQRQSREHTDGTHEQFGSSVGRHTFTAKWRTVREDSRAGGDAWTCAPADTPDLPHQEVTR